MLPKDESLRVKWEAATNFNVHDRNMIWGNYSYAAQRDDKHRMDLEEKTMRIVLAKLALGETVNLRQIHMAVLRGQL